MRVDTLLLPLPDSFGGEGRGEGAAYRIAEAQKPLPEYQQRRIGYACLMNASSPPRVRVAAYHRDRHLGRWRRE